MFVLIMIVINCIKTMRKLIWVDIRMSQRLTWNESKDAILGIKLEVLFETMTPPPFK